MREDVEPFEHWEACETLGDLIDHYQWVLGRPASHEGRAELFRQAEDKLAEELCRVGPVVCNGKVWAAITPVRMGRFGETLVRNAHVVATSWAGPDPEAVTVTASREKVAGFLGTESPS